MTETVATESAEKKAKYQGFASMDPEKRREIAKKGGIVAWARGNSHRFTPEEARAAALKGAKLRRERRNQSQETSSSS